MYRELVVANRQMFVNLDKHLNIRDFYYPHVGLFNHLTGNKNLLAVNIDGKTYFIDDTWEISFSYKKDTLIGDITTENKNLQIKLKITEVVHKYLPLYIRKITIKNLSEEERNIKIYFYHDFALNETPFGNTALYHPELNGIVHYKLHTYFLISIYPDPFEFTVSKKEFSSLDEIKEGKLLGRLIVRGDIDSAIGYSMSLKENQEDTFYYYILAGNSFDDLEEKNEKIKKDGLAHLIEETEVYYNVWIKEKRDLKYDIPEDIQKLYDKSLFIINAHIDRNGAIIASADSSIFQRFNKDHYSYSWPRDNAFIVMALDGAGFGHISRKFFEFASRTITRKGYFLQKYSPDGSFGSSWHPWSDTNKNPQLPIQEDETALVIWALYNHYKKTKNIEFIDRMYNRLVRPAAEFMCSYRYEDTGLPMKSYDPWEERRGIFTYTCATVYAGLQGASELAFLTGNYEEGEKYKKVAHEVKEATFKYLYDENEKRFIRSLEKVEDGKWIKDKIIDASLSAVFFTGLLPFNDEKVINTMKAIEEKLWIRKGIGGLARFENDYYHRVDKELSGNPWIITTMWLADWYIEKGDFEKSLELLKWVVERQSQAGLLAEQYNPYTGEPLSVIPLTWSHAAFCLTVQKLNEKI